MFSFNVYYLRTLSGMLKIVEIVMVVTAFAIMRGTHSYFNEDAYYFGVGTMFSCMLVTPLLLVCYLMGKMEIQKTIMEIVLNFMFLFFLTIYGAMGMNSYTTLNYTQSVKSSGIAMSFFTLCAAMAYLGDTVMAVINYNN